MLEMREKRGLVYGISSFNDSFMCMGVTGVYFTSSNKDIATVVKHVIMVLKKIKENGIKKSILDYSKASYINKLRYRLTEVEYAAERSMLRHYYKCDWDENAVIKRLQRIKNNSIMSLSQDIFDFNKMCIVSIGRYDDPKTSENQIMDVI
jgi:predicted Zn-dependent peptidase